MPDPGSFLSIIIPIFNEAENLPELRRRVTDFLASTAASGGGGFDRAEVLLISDGSRDASEALIARIVDEDPLFTGIFLTRNFGHQAAVSTGLAHCKGDVVAIIDGDLQDPPEAIGLLVQAIRDGADVAYGVRRARKENILKRAAYFAFYRTLRNVASIDIPLDTGDFCVMRRTVVDDMLRLPERNRFVRGLRAWVGYKQVGVEYERSARHAGTPKYTLRKLLSLAYDGLFSFSSVPVRIMQVLGFAISGISFLTAIVYLTLALVVADPTWPRGWPTLIISIWFLGGVQLLFMGIVGEYVHRTFDETRRRPVALIRQHLVHPRAADGRGTEIVVCKATTDAFTRTSTAGTGGGARVNAS
jgi:dolichol-phosphate mannosyltransferase